MPEVVYVEPEPVPMDDVVYDAVCNQGLAWDCGTALNIAYCESRWQPWKDNNYGSGATGLFQMMLPLHWGLFDGNPYDAYANARAAFRLYNGNGWWPWRACL